MTTTDEKKLLLSIKIIPLTLCVILALIGISVAITVNNITFKEEINKLRTEYIKKEKQIIKNEVLKVHNNIINEQKLTKDKLKRNIQEKVYIAHSIATSIYEKYKDTKTKQEIQNLIKNALVNIRFNQGRGYFFIYSLDYKCILLPTNRNLEGKNFYNFKDGKGKYLTREIVKQIKTENNHEGFLTWWYHKPTIQKQQFEKIGFNKLFEPYNWFIGTGEYIKDFEEVVKDDITKRLSTYTYGKNYYVFIFDKNGTTLTHKYKNQIGINHFYDQDNHGNYFIQNILETAKENKGFVEYTWLKQGSDIQTEKISYVKQLDSWNWTIGSGFHTDDLNHKINDKKEELIKANQQEVKTIIIISVIVTLFIIILSMVLSYLIQKRFKEYKETATLKDKILSEQSKLAAMGEMMGNIAHQWRQPLSIISTGATGIKFQKEFHTLDDVYLIKTCELINDNAQYLSRTIDDFKNFIKGDRIKEEFCLEDTINSFLNLVEGSIKKHRINVVLNLEENIIIDGYSNELIQCLINIFNNAKDALNDKEIGNKIVMISSYEKDNKIIIKIIDNAKGIDNHIISKIFEPYFTTKHKSRGTGLGLNMTYKFIVDGMNGTISVKNQKFKYQKMRYFGAEFTIVLPKK